jgi:hypothetical protein
MMPERPESIVSPRRKYPDLQQVSCVVSGWVGMECVRYGDPVVGWVHRVELE